MSVEPRESPTLFFKTFSFAEKFLSKFDCRLRDLIEVNFLTNSNSEKTFRNFHTHSEALQDLFAYLIGDMTGIKTYLEIGSGNPIHGNNTYVLEKFGWYGLSVELDEALVEDFKLIRKNPVLNCDATKIHYEIEIRKFFSSDSIGFLQIDIDPCAQSLLVLQSIPFDKIDFACIVFEHDKYRAGNKIRNLQRNFLSEHGYYLLASDVRCNKIFKFEDWWVHPKIVSSTLINQFQSDSLHPSKMDWERLYMGLSRDH